MGARGQFREALHNVTNSERPPVLRFSLWTLFVLVTFLSIACVALKYAGPMWWLILSSASLLLFLAAAVVAIVGRQEQRAFAIGFTVCTIAYGTLLLIAGSSEALTPNLYQAWLPTAKALQALYRVVDSGSYVDSVTGKSLPNYKPPAGGSGGSGFGGMGGGMGGMSGGTAAYYLGSPPFDQFMRIGHLLWLDVLGLMGAFFAYYVCKRNKLLTSEGSEATLR
jgi:hypothetical protein